MNLKSIIYLFTLILVVQTGNTSQSAEEKTCVILNEEYNNAYLYPERTTLILFSQKYVCAWDPFLNAKKPAEYTNKVMEAIWIFIPVAGKKDTYFVKNFKNGEYLLYVRKRQEPNRRVMTSKYKDADDKGEKFMWKFLRLDNRKFEIWSAKYKERL